MRDYYYILGVEQNCKAEAIKDAYRKLSKKFHPDLNQNDSYFENRFKEIQEAYEILSDPIRRRRYDHQFTNTKSATVNPEPPKQRRYPRTTAIDIIFTLVLIGITALFGNYVIKSMSETPKHIVANKNPAAADTQIVTLPVKHHKRKKHKRVVTNKQVSGNDNSIKKASVVLSKVRADTVNPHSSAAINRITPLSVKLANNPVDNNIPYSSYLRGNITGVINMHRSDDLNSAIIAVIPTHSKVLVLQKGDAYYKVQYNGNEGYVPGWTVLTK